MSNAGQITYETLDADIDRVAARLSGAGLAGPERLVAVQANNPYLHWLFLLALARLGIPSAPDTASIAADLLVSDAPARGAAVVADEAWVRATLSAPRPHVRRSIAPASGLARMMPSSGTTGDAKRLTYSWSWIDAVGKTALLPHASMPMRTMVLTGIDTMAGFMIPISAWLGGGAMVAPPPLPQLLPTLPTLRPNVVLMATGQLAAIAPHLPPGMPKMPDLVLTVGGSALSPALARRVTERLGCELRMVYGATEAGPVSFGRAALLDRAPDASGYPMPWVEIEAVDEAGAPVAPGFPGAIRIRGPHVLSRYEDDPAASARSFRDGWFYPGDIGVVEADGLLRVLGRADELMNIGGVKLLPAMLENPVLACPGVLEAAAFTVPDASGGGLRPHIAIVRGSDFAEASAARASAGVAPIAPPVLVWVDAIPKNAMGKPDRAKLCAAVQAAAGRE